MDSNVNNPILKIEKVDDNTKSGFENLEKPIYHIDSNEGI